VEESDGIQQNYFLQYFYAFLDTASQLLLYTSFAAVFLVLSKGRRKIGCNKKNPFL